MSRRNSLAEKARRRTERILRHENRPAPFGRYADCDGCGKYRVVFTAKICTGCARRMAETLAGAACHRVKLTLRRAAR